jgi:hypothetical protein
MRRTLVILFSLSLSTTAWAQQPTLETVLQDKLEHTAGAGNDIVELYLANQLGITKLASQAFIAAANQQRTDQQTTASSSAPGAVSNVEKTGIADILALAIERGKVTETKTSTSATLSTTPYALQTFFGLPDTPKNWQEYRWARIISFSSTFSSPDVGKNADFSSFTSGEAKVVLAGNRSPRDAVFDQKMRTLLDPGLAKPLSDKSHECGVFESTTFGDSLITSTMTKFSDWLNDPAHASATPSDVEQELATIVPKPMALDTETEQALRRCVDSIGNLTTAMQLDEQQLKRLIKAYVAQNKHFQASASYLFTRDATLSDYSSLKVLLARDNSPNGISYNLNAQVDVNKNTGPRTTTTSEGVSTTVDLRKIRGYSIETGATLGRFSDGRGDATFSLKWLLPSGAGAKSSVTGQGQVNVHLNTMITVPIALSYNSRSTDTVKKGLQLNFGVSSLLDAFLSNSGHQ